MENTKIKVYVKIDENNVIKEIQSSIFLNDTEGWIEIDEGIGDKFAHAQGHYLPKPIIDENGKYNFKYENRVVELSEEEKEALFPTPKPTPSELDKLEARLTYLEIMSEVL